MSLIFVGLLAETGFLFFNVVGFKRLEVFLKFDGLLNVNNERGSGSARTIGCWSVACTVWHVMQLPADNFFPF